MPHKDPEMHRSYHRAYNKAHPDKAYHQEYNQAHRERAREYMRVRKAKLKVQVFEAYGGAICACCGETHIEFLSIDHINGKGASHRREIANNNRGGSDFYKWLKDNQFPLGYRVLCINCNFALGHFGYCPHNLVAPVPMQVLLSAADDRRRRPRKAVKPIFEEHAGLPLQDMASS